MKTQTIMPAIIADSYDQLQSHVRDVRSVVRRVQLDVMDGSYAPTTSWPYGNKDTNEFDLARREDAGLPYWQDVDYEVDLMVLEPEKHVEEWALAGAACIIVHVESTQNVENVMENCFARRLEVALALKPSTDIEVLAPLIDRVLFVQCMGNNRIGYHEVSLDPVVLEKVKAIKKRWPTALVGVDIGVNTETIPALVEAGVDRFAAGSAVFGNLDPEQTIGQLEDLVSKSKKETA